MEQPALSIIIPAYNVEKYIIRSVYSALAQSNIDLEVIVFDDGSTDNIKSVLEKEYSNDKRIKYYTRENRGLYKTRCEAAEKSLGKYLAFLDADDYLDADFFEPLIARAEKENLDIIEFGSRRVNDDGQTLSTLQLFEEYKDYLTAVKKLVNKSNCMCSVCNKIYKKSLFDFDELKKYEAKRYEEDLLINLVVFEKVSSILTVKDVGYNYLVRENSITTSKIDYREESYLHTWRLIFDRYKDSAIKQIIAMAYCSRLAYSYCMSRKNKYSKEDLLVFVRLFKNLYKTYSLKKYKFEYESFNKKTMIKLFRLSPAICYLAFLTKKQ